MQKSNSYCNKKREVDQVTKIKKKNRVIFEQGGELDKNDRTSKDQERKVDKFWCLDPKKEK